MALKTHSPQISRLKVEAQKLYNEGFMQKEVGKALGISEKTIGQWVKDGQWKTKRKIKVSVGLSPLLAKFITFVMEKKPSLIAELEKLQEEFRKK